MVNAAFSNFLNENFVNFIIAYTDGSVAPLSDDYAAVCILHPRDTYLLYQQSPFFIFFLLSRMICYHWRALTLILNYNPNNYLITTDFMSCLQALKSNPFNYHLYPPILHIKLLICTLKQLSYNINFLWIPSHIGIRGNEVVDNLAKSTSNLISRCFTQLPQSDFTHLLKQ